MGRNYDVINFNSKTPYFKRRPRVAIFADIKIVTMFIKTIIKDLDFFWFISFLHFIFFRDICCSVFCFVLLINLFFTKLSFHFLPTVLFNNLNVFY